MARKRMFDIEIINQESFFELPMDAKALYFLLGMEADDEGFITPKKVLRLYGGTEDSIKILIAKNYLIPFKSGVVVITDWKRNNYLDKKRIKETIYLDEKKELTYDEEKEKYILNCQSLTNVKQMLNEYSIEENRIEEYSIEKNNKEKDVVEVENELKIYSYIESNLGITISGTNYDKINLWLETFNDTMLCYAIDKTIAGGKRTLNYFFGILENWKQENFKTMEDVKNNEIKPKNKKQEVVYELV